MRHTTSTGTTIEFVHDGGEVFVFCDNPAAPVDMRNQEVGRVIDGAFQPAPFAAFGLRPEVLRGIATLVERVTR